MNIISYSHVKTNEKVRDILARDDLRQKKLVDIGAGEGYFCKMMGEYLKETYAVSPASVLSACDLFPETFKYLEIGCDRIDANGRLPYDDNCFDAVSCIEVVEHIEDQFRLVRELYRITRPGGRVIMTTPNLLNINSRIRSFYSGFGLLYNPLPLRSKDPVHLGGHIHPVTFYYLAYIFCRAGFTSVKAHFDRRKRSSVAWSFLFYGPIMVAHAAYMFSLRAKEESSFEENRELLAAVNSLDMLTSRTVIVEGVK